MDLQKVIADPVIDRKIHRTLTLLWLLLIPPSVILWKNSIPYLVAVSVYANLAGHYASWQAAKAEDRIMELLKQVKEAQ